MSDYIAPQKEFKRFTCPHCSTLAQMTFEKHAFQESISYIESRQESENVVHIAKCHCCGKKIIWIDDTYIYPDIPAIPPNEDMPNSVKPTYEEASLIYNKSPRAACALLRLAIEKLCNELGENNSDINKNIGELVKRGLPQKVQQALDIVRVVGNKAVHPGQIALDVDVKDTALTLMRLLNIIVEKMISEPNEISSIYSLLPDSAKKAVERRDLVKDKDFSS